MKKLKSSITSFRLTDFLESLGHGADQILTHIAWYGVPDVLYLVPKIVDVSARRKLPELAFHVIPEMFDGV